MLKWHSDFMRALCVNKFPSMNVGLLFLKVPRHSPNADTLLSITKLIPNEPRKMAANGQNITKIQPNKLF